MTVKLAMGEFLPRMRSRWTAALFILACGVGAHTPGWAADPVDGLWEQVDEDGEAGALVTISDHNGVVEGVISKVLPGPAPVPDTCQKCSGAKKGARLVGLKIIENMHREGNAYTGGTITDPENGKEYTAQMRLSPDGSTLDVRGYIGTPLLGRSQTWRRRG